MHKCSHCGEVLVSVSLACPLCGMTSRAETEDLGFSTSFEAIKFFESELASIESLRIPSTFILLNKPNRYVPLIARCLDLERRLRIAFSLYAADPPVAESLQDVYSRIVVYRHSLEHKFEDIDTLFKGSVTMIIIMFGLLSSLFETILDALSYADTARTLHRVSDALNHSALSFLLVALLIYLTATSYNTRKRYFHSEN